MISLQARVSRVFTYWGAKIYPKQFADQLMMDAIQEEPNTSRQQPTVIPNHNLANETLQQTLQSKSKMMNNPFVCETLRLF